MVLSRLYAVVLSSESLQVGLSSVEFSSGVVF